HRRLLARCQRGEVDTEARQTECIAECPLLAWRHPRAERLRVAGSRVRLDRGGIQRGLVQRHVSFLSCKGASGPCARTSGSIAKKLVCARNQSDADWHGV